MLKIGVAGLGQMGLNYLRNLQELGQSVDQIVGCDIDAGRIKKVCATYPDLVTTQSIEELAANADSFIVTVNTPSHCEVIETIADNAAERVIGKNGAAYILCEKPLVQHTADLKRLQELEARYKGLKILTALVITFSDARQMLESVMQADSLELRYAGGRWGKNRGRDSEKRPTAGDRVDEFIHMVEFLFSLMRKEGITYSDVISQVEHLEYVDEEVQSAAHQYDSSFPLKPDHATQALLNVKAGNNMVPMCLSSSFLEAQQVRQVWGTLCAPGTEKPVYSFDISFDTPKGDVLTLTQVRWNIVKPLEHPGNKLLSLTRAFLDLVTQGVLDERLADIGWAGRFVELADAIGESDRRRRKGSGREVRVTF